MSSHPRPGRAIDHLGAAAGLDLHGEQVQGYKTNSAVLHGRVFGRRPLWRDTAYGAQEAAAVRIAVHLDEQAR